jgi:peptide/nickel transport system substrate-binding protein
MLSNAAQSAKLPEYFKDNGKGGAMSSAKRLYTAFAVLLLVSLLSGACGPAATPSPATQAPETAPAPETEAPPETEALPAGPSGTLTVALTTFPNSLDMATTAERNAENAAVQLYDSLVWINDEGRVVPALAESWEVSEDGTEYTFHLRQGVTFHNGEPLTADAVVFSWQRGSQPDMEWSDRWLRASSVEAIDENTVRITTESPDPLLLRVISQNWAIVPPQYIAEVGEDGFNEHPVGTGPFRFVEWTRGDRVVYEANPDYWDPEYPRIQNLIFRSIPESSTRVAAIQTGEVDIVTRLSAEEAQQLEGVEGIHVISYPVDRVYYIAFNNLTTGVGTPVGDLANPQVRQAMNYAVDRQAIVDALFGGNGRLATGLISSSDLGYSTDLQPYPYDRDMARQLLADAGYPDGFEIGMACPQGAYTHFEEVCEAIAEDLRDVGITVDLQLMESGAFWDLEAAKQLPPLFGDSWSERTGEALPRLIGALAGPNASYSSWSDPEIDRLLAEIGQTVDEEARVALYEELGQYMYDNPPFIYLYEPVTFEAVSDRVQGYLPRGAEDYYLKGVTVTD